VGPGQSPGVVKPDFVEFGGCLQRPFIVLNEGAAVGLEATEGTSFSAPSVLRLGAGLRAHFGANLSILAIRALLIHTTEACDFACEEVGRGRVARSLKDIVLCADDTVRVVYQGSIAPTRYIRAPIPVPSGSIPGKVTITATLCYPTGVDPHHPGNYTRAGLEPTFRPHDLKRRDPKQVHPDSKRFFGKTQSGLLEDELRRDAGSGRIVCTVARRSRKKACGTLSSISTITHGRTARTLRRRKFYRTHWSSACQAPWRSIRQGRSQICQTARGPAARG
jgi:hypothetical protein